MSQLKTLMPLAVFMLAVQSSVLKSCECSARLMYSSVGARRLWRHWTRLIHRLHPWHPICSGPDRRAVDEDCRDASDTAAVSSSRPCALLISQISLLLNSAYLSWPYFVGTDWR